MTPHKLSWMRSLPAIPQSFWKSRWKKRLVRMRWRLTRAWLRGIAQLPVNLVLAAVENGGVRRGKCVAQPRGNRLAMSTAADPEAHSGVGGVGQHGTNGYDQPQRRREGKVYIQTILQCRRHQKQGPSGQHDQLRLRRCSAALEGQRKEALNVTPVANTERVCSLAWFSFIGISTGNLPLSCFLVYGVFTPDAGNE